MKKLILFINIIFIIIGLLSIPLALTSVMIFDAPGSENNTYLWVAFWSAVALPFTCAGSVITSSLVAKNPLNYKKALWISLTPCIVLAIFIGSMTMIQIYCNGNFSCTA